MVSIFTALHVMLQQNILPKFIITETRCIIKQKLLIWATDKLGGNEAGAANTAWNSKRYENKPANK